MGVEDRDWFKEQPIYGPVPPRSASPRPQGAGSRATAARRRTQLGLRPGAGLAILLSAAATLAAWHWHFGVPIAGNSPPTSFTTPQVFQPPTQRTRQTEANNLVQLLYRPGLDDRATTVTRWSITDPRFGTISVYVPVGETPRKALTVALTQRGYQVIP